MPTEGRGLSPGAIGDVAAAVAVAEVAAARLAGHVADESAGHAADRCADGSAASADMPDMMRTAAAAVLTGGTP